jgi:mannosyltransferase
MLHYAALGTIVLVGAWLRLTALSRQSLWFDEIDVVVRAQRPMHSVLHTFVASGENGPLYNLMLALWVRVAGVSEIAVRFPSAVAGVLALPLIYMLGRRLANPTLGLYAAGLLAISPYHVWYSQEAKMYGILVLLALGSTLLLVEALLRNRPDWWVAYAVVTTLMFYTHVASVLVFVGQTLYVVATRRAWHGRERGWLAAAAALTLPYVPIALWALRVVGGGVSTWQPDVGLWDAIHILGVKFAVNRSEADLERRGALLYAALAVVGAVAWSWRCRALWQRWWLLLLAGAATPVVGLYLVSLRQSVFSDRYAIVALPAYLLLVAAALAWLTRQRRARPLAALALLALLLCAWTPLRDVNRSSQAQKEDWRSAYADVAARAQPGDVLIVHPGYLLTTHTYYAQREPRLTRYQVLTIPSFKVGWLSEALMIQMMREQAPNATRFWLIQSPDRVSAEDPQHALEHWLATTGTRRYEHEVTGVRVDLFELPPP